MTATLTELQTRFRDFVVGDAPAPTDLAQSSQTADAEILLSVYRDAYGLRLLEALGEDYRALGRLLGAERFEDLGHAYIAATKSRHPSIRWFGRDLAAHVGRDSAFASIPATAELAAWEWALGEAGDAADADPVGINAFAAVPPDAWANIRLTFHPSLRRLDHSWSVAAYRQAVEDDEAPVAPERSQAPVAWVIWRSGTDVLYRSLPSDEARALDAARTGATFGDICGMIAGNGDAGTAAATAAGFLRSWVDGSMVAGISAEPA